MTIRTVAPVLCRCHPLRAEFQDVLGHDRVGHLVSNALIRAGFARTAELATATDGELLAVRELGEAGLSRVRERIPTGAPAGVYSPTALMERLPIRVEPWMLTDSDRAAPLWLLTFFPADEPRIWGHVRPTVIGWKRMLREPRWTGAERALIRAASSLAGVGTAVDLDHLAVDLDNARWGALLEAMRVRRAGLRGRA